MTYLGWSARIDEPGFLASARAYDGRFCDGAAARRWLLQRRASQRCDVRRIPFSELRGWHFESGSGDLVHDSGQFFRVQGIRAHSDFQTVVEFDQPIIKLGAHVVEAVSQPRLADFIADRVS